MNYEKYFDELYKSTNKKVLAYIISKCGNTEDINDLFQETYIEVAKLIKRKGINYIHEPNSFVIKIAKRKIYRHYNFLSQIKKNNHCNIDEYEIVDSTSLEEIIITIDMIDEIKKYLKTKKELTRKIFYLYYGMDMSIKDIAINLSITESNVKNHLYRTINEIKNNFSQ